MFSNIQNNNVSMLNLIVLKKMRCRLFSCANNFNDFFFAVVIVISNDKYKLPAEFWKDVNHVEILLQDMNESNAKTVFQHINAFNDRYMRYAMNYTYDQQVTRLINKYNNKISIITKTK